MMAKFGHDVIVIFSYARAACFLVMQATVIPVPFEPDPFSRDLLPVWSIDFTVRRMRWSEATEGAKIYWHSSVRPAMVQNVSCSIV